MDVKIQFEVLRNSCKYYQYYGVNTCKIKRKDGIYFDCESKDCPILKK